MPAPRILVGLTALSLLACSFEDTAPGVRGPCASASADPVCESEPLESPEDACWKLVECGSIPVANSEDEPDCCFDYSHCVDHFEGLTAHRLTVSLACVGAATCDELRFVNGPERPRRNVAQMPPCLQHGDQ